MKTFYLASLTLALVFFSCTVEKRIYMKGHHVSRIKKQSAKPKEALVKKTKYQPPEKTDMNLSNEMYKQEERNDRELILTSSMNTLPTLLTKKKSIPTKKKTSP